MGQGVIAETLNLSRLKGYETGGTLHVVVNNQVGFTTDPSDSRSSIYSTAIAQMLDVPVFHVNGDDPEACVHVARLAAEFRQTFKSDVVIDLICYRRYGHNEGDDPSFTQPHMYELIRKQQTVRTVYAKALADKNRISAEESESIKQACLKDFDDIHFVAPSDSGLTVGGYTRLGAPLRHLTNRLLREPSERRLLIVIGDGLMSDEGYEGRYAWADVAHAV